jgi:hypothetical protein
MKRLLVLAAIAPLGFSAARAEPAPVAAPVPPAAVTQSSTAQVASAPAAAPQTAVAPPAVCCRAIGGTPIVLQIVNTVTTKVVKKGDRFAIRLVSPIVVDGKVLVPAGVTGEGEVIDAAHGGLMGKAGELLLAARYLDYNGVRIPLRSLKLGGRGTDNTNLSMAVGMIGLPGAVASIFIKGGEVEVPPGTLATAKLAGDLDLPPVALAETTTAPVTSSPTTATTTTASTETAAPVAAPATPK